MTDMTVSKSRLVVANTPADLVEVVVRGSGVVSSSVVVLSSVVVSLVVSGFSVVWKEDPSGAVVVVETSSSSSSPSVDVTTVLVQVNSKPEQRVNSARASARRDCELSPVKS